MANTKVFKKPILYDVQVSYIEIYTPASAAITSTALGGKTLTYAFFQTSADCNITIIGAGSGSTATVVAVKGGVPYPYAVSQITNVSGGAVVYILHNGF